MLGQLCKGWGVKRIKRKGQGLRDEITGAGLDPTNPGKQKYAIELWEPKNKTECGKRRTSSGGRPNRNSVRGRGRGRLAF